jgi:enoyl-[acyl-carrier protein] reductase II
MASAWGNRITGLLGCDYPIVAGPMRLITLGRMAACISGAGGFGVIAASGLARGDLVREIETARGLTDRPIGVKIPVYRPNALEALGVAMDMGIRNVYTSAGNPARLMDPIRKAGMNVIHKVSSLDTARKAEAAAWIAVVAMGFEAGGHIGRECVTTFCLVPILVRTLKIPVIASGGIGDAGGLSSPRWRWAHRVWRSAPGWWPPAMCPVPAFFKTPSAGLAGRHRGSRQGGHAHPVLKNIVTGNVAGMSGGDADRAIAARGDASYVADGGDKDTAVMPCGQVAGW